MNQNYKRTEGGLSTYCFNYSSVVSNSYRNDLRDSVAVKPYSTRKVLLKYLAFAKPTA